MIKFTVIGNPEPKLRPRFFVAGKRAMAYTPKKTIIAENDFKYQSLKHRPEKPLEGALFLHIRIFRAMPKSLSSKKQDLAEFGTIRPVSRPDFDNYAKLVCDSMNKIFFNDDSQIVDCRVEKYYSRNPRTSIEIKSLQEA